MSLLPGPVRTLVPGADEEDLRLLDDLIGIADPDVALPQVDPDARRRRLIALMNTASLARTKPAFVIIEDAHWMTWSVSQLAGFLSVIASTPSMTLITARPEYQGLLTQIPGAQTIALAPLVDSATADLVDELIGPDPSVAELAAMIADRAGGNPFFAEEMVRELAQRGVLTGQLGNYVCRSDVGDIAVPGTVQAAIEARIDRLSAQAKRALNAAAVIGARFDAELLTGIGVDPVMDELLGAYLVDQVRFTPIPEYAFHHPLIHAVAYESQLKSDRAEWHRRLAVAIQERVPESLDEHAALIAEHLESAAVPRAAYEWHMRAGSMADQPRCRRCPAELGAGPAGSRMDYPTRTPTSSPCVSHPGRCCRSPTFTRARSMKAEGGSPNSGSCATRPTTRYRLPSG